MAEDETNNADTPSGAEDAEEVGDSASAGEAGSETPPAQAAGERAPGEVSEQELADQALAAAREAIASLGGDADSGGSAQGAGAAADAGDQDGEPTAEPTAEQAAASEDPASQAAAALEAARAAVSETRNADEPVAESPTADAMSAFTPPELSGAASDGEGQVIDLLNDVNLDVKIELGRTRMLIEDVLRLSDGAVVELDKLAGDPVDVYVNNRHIARGEVLVLNENFCVRINEIIEHDVGAIAGE